MKVFGVISLFVFLWLAGLPAFAQSINVFEKVEGQSDAGGKVEIVQDDKLYQSVNEHIHYQRNQKGIPGYRINISSEKNRKLAESERSRFLKLYPDVNAELKYVAPSFNVYVGNYRKRSDVYKIFREVKEEFPNAYIVPMSINFPKLD